MSRIPLNSIQSSTTHHIDYLDALLQMSWVVQLEFESHCVCVPRTMLSLKECILQADMPWDSPLTRDTLVEGNNGKLPQENAESSSGRC